MSDRLVGVATWRPQTLYRAALSATWPDIVYEPDGWSDMYRLYDAGTIPFVHPMFKHATSGNHQIIDEILAGNFDHEINTYLDSIVTYVATGRKLVLVFLPEMNGIWVNYGPVKSKTLTQNYANGRAVYRKMVTMARLKGLNRDSGVLFCYAPNDVGWGKFAPYWPGNDYVDIVGGSAYNRGDVYDWWAPWETPTQAIGSYVTDIRKLTNKPIVITQTGSGEGDSRTPDWLSTLVEYTKQDQIEGFIWFDISEYTYQPGPADFNARTASLNTKQPNHWYNPTPPEPPSGPTMPTSGYLEVSYGDGMGAKTNMAPAVSAWQGTLKALGRPDGNSQSPTGVDGKFGSGTRNATVLVQKDLKLNPTGIADPHTRSVAERARL